MFTAAVAFDLAGADEDVLRERALDLMSAWYTNGQILSREWTGAARGTTLEISVTIPERSALDSVKDNVYARKAREALGESGPRITSVSRDPWLLPACTCASSSALVLYTDYLSSVPPPVRCLDCFHPVPLYRLPHVHDHEHLQLLHWASDYRACDTLQMHCTVGERFGETQLASHDSALSRCGRDLARRLESALKTPVFYYLHKTRGRGRKSELARRCPSCSSSSWLLDERLHLFDFRCDVCRLVADLAP